MSDSVMTDRMDTAARPRGAPVVATATRLPPPPEPAVPPEAAAPPVPVVAARGRRWVVTDLAGAAVELGDLVTSLSGERAAFAGVLLGPERDGVPRVLLSGPDGSAREGYARVWGLRVGRAGGGRS